MGLAPRNGIKTTKPVAVQKSALIVPGVNGTDTDEGKKKVIEHIRVKTLGINRQLKQSTKRLERIIQI